MTEAPRPTVALDREPFGPHETAVVNGFPQIEPLEEIWIREVNPQLTGSYPVMRFYLALRDINDARARELTDRIIEAFNTRFYFDKVEFKFIPMQWGPVPPDLPSRIWRRRTAIVAPTAREIELAKKGLLR